MSAYVNKYELDMTDLRVLDLSMEEIQRLYPALHEASEDKFVEVAKDINKAAGTTLLALARVMGCEVEDLLEI